MYLSRRIVLLGLLPAIVVAEPLSQSAAAPGMQATRLDVPPIIDGKVVADDAWDSAIPSSGFWQVQPRAGEPSTQRTDVYVGFTESALYVGVVAYDDNPDGIIVADSRRDSSLDDTDAFLFVIDGLLDR